MFTVSIVAYSQSLGLVLSDRREGFLTYMEAKNEVDRLYKESTSDSAYGVVVAAFIVASQNGNIEIVYSSVRQDPPICPVCGKHARLLQADGVPASIVGKWYVFCDGCGLRTGFYDKADDAIDVWMTLSGGDC